MKNTQTVNLLEVSIPCDDICTTIQRNAYDENTDRINLSTLLAQLLWLFVAHCVNPNFLTSFRHHSVRSSFTCNLVCLHSANGSDMAEDATQFLTHGLSSVASFFGL